MTRFFSILKWTFVWEPFKCNAESPTLASTPTTHRISMLEIANCGTSFKDLHLAKWSINTCHLQMLQSQFIHQIHYLFLHLVSGNFAIRSNIVFGLYLLIMRICMAKIDLHSIVLTHTQRQINDFNFTEIKIIFHFNLLHSDDDDDDNNDVGTDSWILNPIACARSYKSKRKTNVTHPISQ